MFKERTTPSVLKSIFLIFFAIIISQGSVSAATIYTRASGNWNVSGGLFSGTWAGLNLGCLAVTGGAFPAAGDNANICNSTTVTVTAAAASNNVTVDGDLIINTGQTITISGNLAINNGGSVTINGTGAINIAGDIIINAGGALVFAAGGNGTIAIAGNWTNNGGTVTTNNQGTVTFNGGTGKAINGTAASQTFYDVVVAKTGGSTLNAAGITTLTSNNFTVTSGAFTAPGTTNINISTIATLTLTAGTYTAGAITNITGNWVNNGGTFTPGTNTVNFIGTLDQAIKGTAVSQTFYNVFVVKSVGTTLSVIGSTVTLNTNNFTETTGNYIAPATMNITSTSTATLTLTAGTFTAGANINITGDWIVIIGSSFVPGTNTVTFNGSGAQAIKGSITAQTFYNVVVAKTAGTTLTVTSPTVTITVQDLTETTGNFTAPPTVGTGMLNVNGNILISAGTFSSSGTINLAGNITNNSTYTGTSQTLNFTGAINSIVSGIGTWTLNNITMNKSALATILEIQAAAFSNAVTGGKTLMTMGTFKHNCTGTWNYMDDMRLGVPTANFSINSNVKLWIQQGTVYLVQNGAAKDVNPTTTVASGAVQVDGGTLNVATGADNYFNICSSNLTVNGGVVNVGGLSGSSGGIRFYKPIATVPSTNITGGSVNVYGTFTEGGGIASGFSMSSGTLNLSLGTSAPSTYSFQIQNTAASSFTMSNGSIIIQKPTNGGSDFDICGTNGLVNVTGGTIQFGTATTPINKTFVFTPYISAIANNVFPNIKLAGTSGDKLVSKSGSASDFRFLSLYISANNTFDFVNAASNNLTLMSTYDGTNTFYNDGALTQQTSTLTFNGSVNQHISGTTNTLFNNFTINNAAGITLDSPETINAALTLFNGILTTTSVNLLALTNLASSTSGSGSSFVSGPMSKNGNTAFSFPVGKGSSWMRIDISAPSASSTFTAEYFNTPFANISSVNSPLNNVSYLDYWTLNRTVGAGDAFITFHWENATASGINNCPDLTLARWNGASWDEYPGTTSGSSFCSGIGSGTVSSNVAITAFGPFSFGSKLNSVNPLPIDLLNFTAIYNGPAVDLIWSTATETNSDYYTVERASDGLNFEPVAIVDAAGNSNRLLKYKALDSHPLNDTSYYRLKRTNFDGRYFYSKLVSVQMADDFAFSIYPNPSKSGESLSMSCPNNMKGQKVSVTLNDIQGKTVYSKEIIIEMDSDKNVEMIDFSSKLSSGIYIITASSDQQIYRQKLIIR